MTSHDSDSASGEKEAIQLGQGPQKRRVTLGLRIVILIFLLVLLATPVLVPILIGQNASDDAGRRREDPLTTTD